MAPRRSKPAHSALPLGTAGFTLIEVMIAVAVVATALVPLLRLHLLSLDATIRSQTLTTAVFLTQQKMASLSSAPEPGEEKDTFDDPYAFCQWETLIEEPVEIITDLTVEGVSQGMVTGNVKKFKVQPIAVTVICDGYRYTLESYAVPPSEE